MIPRVFKLLVAALLAGSAVFLVGAVRAGDLPKRTGTAGDRNESLRDEVFRLLQQVYDYDPAIPLDARVVERIDVEGLPREKIVFRGVQGFYLPGYLQLPPHRHGPVPCVLLLHGWSGSKAHFWTDSNYISGGLVRKAVLAAGFAVLAVTAQKR